MKIFISYRHSESVAGTANLLHDRLTEQFGKGSVFLDSDALAFGDRFPAVLEARLASCEIFLALIDSHWIAAAPRLQDPADWVRRELETALQRRARKSVRVIPVLLHGAAMPAPAILPASLAELAERHAAVLRGDTLNDDIGALLQRLKGSTVTRLLLMLKALRHATLWVALGMMVMFSASLMALFDALTLDTRFEALTLALADAFSDPAPNERLAIVAIDKSTESALGKRFDPSWRREHAQLIRNLASAGASAVAFDVHLEKPSPYDGELAAAAEAARAKGTAVIFGSPRAGAAAVLPSPAIEWGLLCVGTELDWARLAPLAVRRAAAAAGAASGGAAPWQYLASLGVRAVAPRARVSSVDIEHHQVILQPADGELLRLPFTRQERLDNEQSCAALVPGDEVAQLLVRFTSLQRLRDPQLRHRYQDLCCKPATPADTRFRDKIVLVGSELEPRDIRHVYRGFYTEPRFGHEVHADTINTLLNEVHIQPLSPLPQFLVMIGMGALGLLSRFWPALWEPLRARLFIVAVPVAYLVFAILLCTEFHLLLNNVYHLAAFAFACWVSDRLLRRRGLHRTNGA